MLLDAREPCVERRDPFDSLVIWRIWESSLRPREISFGNFADQFVYAQSSIASETKKPANSPCLVIVINDRAMSIELTATHRTDATLPSDHPIELARRQSILAIAPTTENLSRVASVSLIPLATKFVSMQGAVTRALRLDLLGVGVRSTHALSPCFRS